MENDNKENTLLLLEILKNVLRKGQTNNCCMNNINILKF